MEWLEVTIKTVSPAVDLLTDWLTAAGYDSFLVEDTADFQSFLEENTQYWDYVEDALAAKMADISQIRLYLEADAQAPEKLDALQTSLAAFRACFPDRDLGELSVSLQNLQEEDWENGWKQYYQPIPVGEKLLIVPEWLHPENPDHRIPVVLDPGMIFGTGAHASTQMCLKALEQTVSGGERVADLGSGSGILSIAALLLGADTAVGVDIDPKAEKIARENAALNGLLPPRFTACTGNIPSDAALMDHLCRVRYDIVLANIVADVILPLAPAVPRLLDSTGIFICSGILNTRLGEVVRALNAAGLHITAQQEENDWCCLTARRR